MLTPKFADAIAWQQAEMLMQPVFIRVLDNIRKALDTSSWSSTYQETPTWAGDVSDAVKSQVLALQQRLKTAAPDETEDIQEALARLPQPHPSYQLLLQKQDKQITVDLWQLCYQVCFKNYSPIVNLSGDVTVEIDTSLIDETGDVNWNRLDNKAKQLIEQIFRSLPNDD